MRLTREDMHRHEVLCWNLSTHRAWFVLGLHVEGRGGTWRTFEVDP